MTTLFSKSWERYRRRQIEFQYLSELIKRDGIAEADRIPGFTELGDNFSFYVRRVGTNQVRVHFGNRPLRRHKIDGSGWAIEQGAALVYSLGPTGGLMVGLFPCKSDLASWKEDAIVWVQGSFSALRMRARLSKDFRDLASYCRVTSLDAEATWMDRIRVAYLGATRSREVGGNYTRASMLKGTGGAVSGLVDAFRVALLEVVLKPLGVLILAAIFAVLGNKELLKLVHGASEVAEKLELETPRNPLAGCPIRSHCAQPGSVQSR
ncbi:hypothetical protein [Phenylobacterium sp.]|uniref:hypothetical protein n=1 Tax=Phenylobacterium sp. TaxID=1871053 RepID=UPI00374D3C15